MVHVGLAEEDVGAQVVVVGGNVREEGGAFAAFVFVVDDIGRLEGLLQGGEVELFVFHVDEDAHGGVGGEDW